MRTPLTEEQRKTGNRLDHIEVNELLSDNRTRLKLEVKAGREGLGRRIEGRELHRPGLALTGYLEHFTYDRVQIFGNTELQYLLSLPHEKGHEALVRIMNYDLPCIILCNDAECPADLVKLANEKAIPVLVSELSTTDLVHLLSDYLSDRFAPFLSVHGSFVDVYGTGLLFTGRSGIGKSEIALDLVERGHRLVADDVVHLTRKGEGVIMGSSPEMIRHMIEVRGLGLVDVRAMFGVRAVRIQKRAEVEVRLMEWDDNYEWERIGLDTEAVSYLGVDIPVVRLPIFPGKNISMIAEVIALNLHLRVYGFNAADEFNRRLREEIDRKSVKQYLIRDYE